MTMKRLNQVLAVEQSSKKRLEDSFTRLFQDVQKPDLTSGFTRSYQSKEDGGENFPNEIKRVQMHARDAIATATKALSELFNLTATKDATNSNAKANIVVDGKVLAKDVPAVHLLFIEKRMVSIIDFIRKLPVLSLDEKWVKDEAQGLFVTEPVESIKTKKLNQHKVVVPATDKFPAQVVATTEDVIQGVWKTTKMSGGVPPHEVTRLLERAERLQRAVKEARQEANEVQVVELSTSSVLDYIFG